MGRRDANKAPEPERIADTAGGEGITLAAADEIFQACDKNNNGLVSKRELKSTLKGNHELLLRLGLKSKRMKDMNAFVHEFMDRFDDDGDKGIDIDEFRKALRVEVPPEEPVSVASGGGGGGGASLVASAKTPPKTPPKTPLKTPLMDDGPDERHDGRVCAACEFSADSGLAGCEIM